jgi:DNA-directed RNA polymerase specialized sigma subunit
MTPELVNMLITLVNRYASRSNWRNYTYLDDMKSEALISLLTGALKYNEETSPNAFGYLTQFIYHSFLTTLEKEKKVRDIRDDILEENGLDPSYTRQLANDESFLRKREVAFYKDELGQKPPVLFNPRRRGRKKKIQVESEKAHELENPPE